MGRGFSIKDDNDLDRLFNNAPKIKQRNSMSSNMKINNGAGSHNTLKDLTIGQEMTAETQNESQNDLKVQSRRSTPRANSMRPPIEEALKKKG